MKNRKIALVTGGSKGVGKGIVLGLCEAGWIVYFTGRNVATLNETHKETSSFDGEAIPVKCDHESDQDVLALFNKINQEFGRLSLLVNNVWGGYEKMIENGRFTWMDPFWEQPLWRWDKIFSVGVRSTFHASQLAKNLMEKEKEALIVNISYWSAQKHLGNIIYGVAKAAIDKMTADMDYELKQTNIRVISLYPGLVRTEKVLESAGFLDLSNSESPIFIGRVVAALGADNSAAIQSGLILVAAKLAQELGIVDVDGKQPTPLTLDSA